MQPLMNADQRRFKEDDFTHQDLVFAVNRCATGLNEISVYQRPSAVKM
jgi:hypothetical protein